MVTDDLKTREELLAELAALRQMLGAATANPDGDDLLQIAPADVARLARLLDGLGRVRASEVAA